MIGIFHVVEIFSKVLSKGAACGTPIVAEPPVPASFVEFPLFSLAIRTHQPFMNWSVRQNDLDLVVIQQGPESLNSVFLVVDQGETSVQAHG